MPRLTISLAFAMFLAGASPALCETVALEGVRHWSSLGVTRIAIETAADVEFSHGTVENPDRIFVDLQGVRPRKYYVTIPVDDGLVKQLRVALTAPGVTRIVVDLERPATFTIGQLSSPSRVMLEVQAAAGSSPVPAPAPAAASNPEPPAVSSAAPPPPRTFVPPAPARRPVRSTPVRFSGRVPIILQDRSIHPAPDRVLSSLSYAPPRLSLARAVSRSGPSVPIRTAPEPVTEPETPVSVPDSGPKPADTTRRGQHSLTRALGLKLQRVVIDPGHGGHDTGTISRNGMLEKDLVLDVSLRLARMIRERLGAEVILTRETDTFIPLEKRPEMANRLKADLFISIHANSSPARSVAGSETYYLNFSDSQPDLEIAARENAGAETTIGELEDVLKKIAQNDKAAESRELASQVQSAAHELTLKTQGAVKNRGVRRAPFVVLIGAEMPGILTEIGFVSNAREESLLRKESHRDRVAEALLKGITAYANSLSQQRVARAED